LSASADYNRCFQSDRSKVTIMQFFNRSTGQLAAVFLTACLLAGFHGDEQSTGNSIQDPVKESAPLQDDTAPADDRIERLEKYLTGAELTGQFTVTGQANDAPRGESYLIEKAIKNPDGDLWTITARIRYGTHDVTVPMVMEIKWAGDTPVITVDQLTIPLMGTFDARVLIRGGLYAGTWRHDEVGGHLFGTVTPAGERAEKEVPADPPTDQSAGGDGG
jgi:hypothetical protein